MVSMLISLTSIRSKITDPDNCNWLAGDISASSDGERVDPKFLPFKEANRIFFYLLVK